jgi:DNA-binding response OmpR family regulator
MSNNLKDLDQIKILVVEDDQHTMLLIRRMLLDLGVVNIFEASDGKEALRLLGSFDGQDLVNVVLCDWKMPNMTGLDVLKQIRACDDDMPFLMITGVADVDSVIEAKAYSVTGYIKKPFSMEVLRKKLRVVQRMLDARKDTAA